MENSLTSSKDVYLEKLRRYCAYQERCQQEVIQKMRELKIDNDWQDEIILQLLEEKYVDEERFARAIVRGKFRIKHWGKNKIRNFLFLKNITSNLIEMSLTEISDSEYNEKIHFLVSKKKEELYNLDQTSQQLKLMSYLLQKGYENELVKNVVLNN